MKVLISNDDGPPNMQESPFILPFIEHLEDLGWDVRVCLPDDQKSWIAKSFMINDEIQVRYYNRKTKQICNDKQNDNDFFLLNGTPATCVNIALNHLFKNEVFDLVLGGPNFGRNVSNLFTLASGTVGAGMEAVLNRQKAIAISFCYCNQRPECIANCCETASDLIKYLYTDKSLPPWPERGMFNINIPMVDYKCPVQITKFHNTSYGSLFQPVLDTTSKAAPVKFRFGPDCATIHAEDDALPGTDKWAIQNKCVSVTPMVAAFQTADHEGNADYNFGSINEKYAAN